jgi:hypothetical protein
VDYEDKTIPLELLIKFYNSKKPIHCSDLAEESILRDKDLLSYACILKGKGLIENPRIFQTESNTPLFFRISLRGKKLVEKIIENFPLDNL